MRMSTCCKRYADMTSCLALCAGRRQKLMRRHKAHRPFTWALTVVVASCNPTHSPPPDRPLYTQAPASLLIVAIMHQFMTGITIGRSSCCIRHSPCRHPPAADPHLTAVTSSQCPLSTPSFRPVSRVYRLVLPACMAWRGMQASKVGEGPVAWNTCNSF